MIAFEWKRLQMSDSERASEKLFVVYIGIRDVSVCVFTVFSASKIYRNFHSKRKKKIMRNFRPAARNSYDFPEIPIGQSIKTTPKTWRFPCYESPGIPGQSGNISREL